MRGASKRSISSAAVLLIKKNKLPPRPKFTPEMEAQCTEKFLHGGRGPVAKRLISAILRYNYGMNPLGSLSSAKKRGHVSKIESLPGLSSRANLRRRTTRCRPERRRFYSGTVNRNARSAGAASRSTSSVKRPLESKKRNARPETEKWCASYSAGNRR